MPDLTAPKRIWLKTDGCYADAYEATLHMDGGVTWADVRQEDDDQDYIRADLVAPLILAASNLRDIETETGLLGPAVTERIDAVLAALEEYLETRVDA